MDQNDTTITNGLSRSALITSLVSTGLYVLGLLMATITYASDPYAGEASYAAAGLLIIVATVGGVTGAGLGIGALNRPHTSKAGSITAICLGAGMLLFFMVSLASA
jgi:hypothetical protein